MKTPEPKKRKYEMTERARRVEETQRAILSAARELFGTRYYDDVSLRAVAARAGVGLQTLIRHFGTKEGLFEAAAQSGRAELVERRRPTPAGDPAAVAQVMAADYELTGDFTMRLLAQEERVSPIGALVRGSRQHHHQWVGDQFDDILPPAEDSTRDAWHALLTVAVDVYTWKILRRDFGLSAADTETAMRELLEALLERRRNS